eukprot:TRINITY_DN670_c0_g2_i1.p1 TRINITY_DN670_c0_g2~~TRINITY_DN670_c0_g2_i1.p1  ORF type:complete len:465 (-),score=123.00 TRINITY_DN670_c0_g2_i1:256-1650(-)
MTNSILREKEEEDNNKEDEVQIKKRKKTPRLDVNSKYWLIHGKLYDLEEFSKKHPGGEYIIRLGQGRDCTEMFESVHAISNLKNIRASLKKFEVKHEDIVDEDIDVEALKEQFSWKEDGFYSVLREKVRKRFENRNYKTTWFCVMKLIVMFILYLTFWYKAISTGNWYYGILTGTLTEMIGFCLMHDSSHNSVSKKPYVNYLGTLWSSWMFWNQWKWLQHHSYGHHSYTGIYARDPDVSHVGIFVRKHKLQKPEKFMKYQHLYAWPLLFFIPNQHVGQIILYQLLDTNLFKKRLFGVLPTKRGPSYVERDNIIVMILSLFFHILIPLYFLTPLQLVLFLFLHYSFMGINYFLCVAPNHDTDLINDNHPAYNPGNIDWGEQQVRTSGNHSLSDSFINKIITHLWGGMNFQTEHHLFPSIHHSHYREIAPIVQETCKEFNIPYNNSGSWFQAMKGYFTIIKKLGSS